MDDTAKYLIHARITADGVVERSDVVGAVFGQTEGLLGDELDLRDLQRSSKVGRIDVEVDSEHGQSFGEITITSSLDKVQTAILAASLESITRVGPCEARVEVAGIEDMRAAKRREVVERAKELLAESFDEGVMDSSEILEEVRDAQRVEQVDEFADYPAGPRVSDSDAVIVVEGRADVSTLLEYGIKNAVAVEGTDVPDPVADLTRERTVTAFLDGDRGGDLILRELAQVGDVDYVAYAPENVSVEDLSREDVMDALREKVPFETLATDGDPRTGDRSTAAQSRAVERSGGGETDRTTGTVRASAADDREAVGGVGGADDSVTVDPTAVVDEIAGGDDRAVDSLQSDPEGSRTDSDGSQSESNRSTATAGGGDDDSPETVDETTGTATDETDEPDEVDETSVDQQADAVADDTVTTAAVTNGAETNASTTRTARTDTETESADAVSTDHETTDGEPATDDRTDEASESPEAPTDGTEAQNDGVDGTDTEPIETDAESAEMDAEPDETDAETDTDETSLEVDETASEADAAASESPETDAGANTDADESTADESTTDDDAPATLRGHVRDVIDAETNTARLLDRELTVVAEVPAGAAFDTLADSETTGFLLVLDGRVDQRLLDVAAQRGVEQIVAASSGEFVKRPASVRVVTADRLASA